MADIVVVGSINADLVVRVPRHPAPGETLLGTSVATLAGGKGANQAVAAARLGASTGMIGAVGDDATAEAALAGLRDAGVDLGGVTRVDRPTGLAVVQVDDAGENSIVVIPGANERVSADHVEEHRATIQAARIVVLQGEIPVEAIAAAARAAHGRIVLNLAPVVAVEPDIVRLADPLVVNEHEARLTLGVLDGLGAGGRVVVESDGAEPGELVRALLGRGARSVVLTTGSAGAVVGRREGGDHTDVHVIPSPRVMVVDTTGAGDAFTGALAAALLLDDDLVAAARFAVRVGAFAVRSTGAQASYPRAGDALPEVTGDAEADAGAARTSPTTASSGADARPIPGNAR